MRASITNKTSIFGIMGGLSTSKISGRSSMNRVTSRLVIPAGEKEGYQYMKMHNLLSRNPLGSGGVGRMFRLRAGGSSLGSIMTSSENSENNLGGPPPPTTKNVCVCIGDEDPGCKIDGTCSTNSDCGSKGRCIEGAGTDLGYCANMYCSDSECNHTAFNCASIYGQCNPNSKTPCKDRGTFGSCVAKTACPSFGDTAGPGETCAATADCLEGLSCLNDPTCTGGDGMPCCVKQKLVGGLSGCSPTGWPCGYSSARNCCSQKCDYNDGMCK
jgi:hypothetical protein